MIYAHQQKIIDDDKKKVGLFLGTGSGKSLTSLYLARGRTLIIVPKTVRDARTWEKEREKLKLDIDMTVLSKEDFKRDVKSLPTYNTVIVDECHMLAGVTPSIRWRNKKPIPKASQVFDMLLSYLTNSPPDRLYALTATPTRSPMVVWGLARLLGHNWDFYAFRSAFYFKLPFGREIYTPRKDTKDRLGKCVRSIGYTGQLSDYFDVPEQTWRTIQVPITKKQKETIQSLALEYPDPLVLAGKKHQVENGTLAGNEFTKGIYINDEKIPVLLKLALEFKKMVIFAKYTLQIEKIKEALIGYTVITMQGHTKDRESIIKQANESKECIFIVQSSISAGWEIPDIPVMVFASLSYSLVDRIQAIGRILRANSLKKNLYIDIIAKGGIDEAVYKAIESKVDFSEHIYAKRS